MTTSSNMISVIVPVFNEENTILKVLLKLNELKKSGFSSEIIVIDDGSTDNTRNILKENSKLTDKLFYNDTNRGKGFSVKRGIENAEGNYIIFQDADLEYDPNDFVKFSKTIKDFEPDLIIGSRFNYSNYTRSHNILNKFGNFFITLIFNLLYNTTFTDIYSCYACYKKELLHYKELKSEGFEQHAEILCKIVKKGKKFYEVPINYNGRSHEEGKKIKFYDIFFVIFQILKERISK
tara:strand:- start:26 stop:733 length:708 start_codon:yes stop_codon:yes gene_type:complete